ncbi:MAG TPA: glycosyl hydrolase family 28 protein [Chthoniobacteraceae bacterium]|jgi:hypothetical protein|nr:glycosyl hydrolase family 28 protein [Chthoniobacteraceae bacterium]
MSKRTIAGFLASSLLALTLLPHTMCGEGRDRVYPAPAGEPLSSQFHVQVGGDTAPVYLARISALTAQQRRPLRAIPESATTTTSFASFDMDGPVQVTITGTAPISAVKVLPTARGIVPAVSGSNVTFTVNEPGQLTIETNGDWMHSLHLFANPMEKDIPDPKDPRVIYFGPGIHRVQSVQVHSGQTLYIAGGAILYSEDSDPKAHPPVLDVSGTNITVRGRGIVDASLCPVHTRSILKVSGSDIRVEGIILRDSSTWTFPVRKACGVKIDNVKIFGWRGNSDGIDLCNCRNVEVTRCFLRTFDDLIVLKTDKGQGELRDVTVKNCVLWNEFAHALSLGAELREPLSDIVFSDCDIIHDKGREWDLRVYNCDSAMVRNVTFDNIRIEESQRLISVWIGKAVWSKEPERGHVDGVVFRNIHSAAPERAGPYAELVGYDAQHAVENVRFDHVAVGGRDLRQSDVRQNPFVSNVTITP